MSRRARLAIFAVSAAVFAFLLIWGLSGLPDFGHYQGRYGRVIAKIAVPERKATNTVVSTTFDFRGFDTLIEEFILFTAAIAVTVLLRAQRGEREQEERAEAQPVREARSSEALRTLGAGLVGPVVVLGLYVVTHGQLTPGGGFQGGVVVMAALLLVYVAGNFFAMRRVSPHALAEAAEGAGAAGFALIGLGGLIFAAAYLENFLPLGEMNDLLSGGTIPLSNVAVGLEVAGAFVLIASELLDQQLMSGRGGDV
ncbi:MAG: hydrogen gas-evolving membrane-bound hydrogenase subunit E [Thermoleophilaceae bacterium]